MSTPVLTYAIDHDDRLVKVDDGYYSFAEANGWDGAGSSLGRSLWDFVAGEEMRKLQRMLLRRLRGEARGVELPFRCDSPAARREMDIRTSSTAPAEPCSSPQACAQNRGGASRSRSSSRPSLARGRSWSCVAGVIGSWSIRNGSRSRSRPHGWSCLTARCCRP
jgi:hypothetical protein